MSEKVGNTLYQNILAAFLILIMHVVLVAGIGVLILFFYGIINHMAWIIIGTSCLFIGGYWLYRRIKSDSRVLRNIAGDSLKGKTVEISFLGGMATFKISDSQVNKRINKDPSNSLRQLEAPNSENINSLTELARLYEKKLITSDEYNKAKEKILK
jgi:hypothetical protein